jgi:hypothetical protein
MIGVDGDVIGVDGKFSINQIAVVFEQPVNSVEFSAFLIRCKRRNKSIRDESFRLNLTVLAIVVKYLAFCPGCGCSRIATHLVRRTETRRWSCLRGAT